MSPWFSTGNDASRSRSRSRRSSSATSSKGINDATMHSPHLSLTPSLDRKNDPPAGADGLGFENRTASVSASPLDDTYSLPDVEQEQDPQRIRIHSQDSSLDSDQISHLTGAQSKHPDAQDAEARRVLRKIDRWLIPILSLIYTLQYIDKSAMSYAAVFTFRQDRGLVGRQYSWLGTLFYVGYTVFEFPGAWLMQKTRTTLFMGTTIIMWGGMVLALAFPESFTGLAILRFLLGAAESVVTPGFALITARFYTRQEQPLRMAFWYCCNGLGSTLGGLLGYGVGHIHAASIHNWAWIFIVNGIITVLAGIVFLAVCPNSPTTARFLSARERITALERVRCNQSSLESRVIKFAHIKECLNPFVDPQSWLLFLATFSLTVTNGGLGNFLHLILNAWGYGSFESILLGLPSGILQTIFVLTSGYIARTYKGTRIYVAVVGTFTALIGIAIQYACRTNGPRLFGYYLIVAFVPALAQIFAMPAANVTGYTKRITTNAMVFLAYGSGNALGPTFWKFGQTPPFKDGMLTCLICFSAAICILLVLRLYYVRENNRRDRLQAGQGQNAAKVADFADVTDVENLSFRYLL